MSTQHAASITPLPQPPSQAAPVLEEAQIEAALLGHILLGMTAQDFQVYAHLTADYFNNDKHKRLWTLIQGVAGEGLTIDLTSIKARSGKMTEAGEAFLTDILTQAGNNPRDYKMILQWIECRRKIEAQLTAMLHINRNRGLSLTQVAGELNRMVTELQVRISSIIGPLSLAYAEMAEDYHAHYTTEDYSGIGISTGYPDLDRSINGFERGRTYVVGAESGGGKSIMVQNFAHRLADSNLRVGFLSFELPEKEYMLRGLAADTMIDMNRIKKRQIDQQEAKRFAEVVARLQHRKDHLQYIYMKQPTLADVLSKIRSLYLTYGIDAVVLDYIKPSRFTPALKEHRGNDVAFLGAITEAVSSITKELNIITFEPFQTTRESQKDGSKPSKTAFQGSSSIEQDADVAMILTQHEAYTEAMGHGEMHLHIVKSRTGGEGDVIRLESRKSMFRFDPWRS